MRLHSISRVASTALAQSQLRYFSLPATRSGPLTAILTRPSSSFTTSQERRQSQYTVTGRQRSSFHRYFSSAPHNALEQKFQKAQEILRAAQYIDNKAFKKWEAWSQERHLSREDAMKQYIEGVEGLRRDETQRRRPEREKMQNTLGHALDLEQLDTDLFRNKTLWNPGGLRAVYGGQVVGQALSAATKTLKTPNPVHSVHAHFLLAGDFTLPIIYRVKDLRDGKSYQTRSVEATQNGQAIFTAVASFNRPEESTFEHQAVMPTYSDPESFPTQLEALQEMVKKESPNLPPELIEKYEKLIEQQIKRPFPLEVRLVNPRNIFHPNVDREGRNMVWMRARVALEDEPAYHQCVAAYASDWTLASAALRYTDVEYSSPHIKFMASLDHAMWFHAPFRADEWMLYETFSPRSSGNRGLNFGKVFTRDGTLVMSTVQETLIRLDPSRNHQKA